MPLRSIRRCCWVLLIAALPARAGAPYHVFPHTQAQRALRVARNECKPLVLHFVPNEQAGAEQIRAYYGPQSPIARADLERVVVVVIPRAKFRDFAESLGVYEAGGLRTVSPYELTCTDRGGLTTVRETFEWQPCGSSNVVPTGEIATNAFTTRKTSHRGQVIFDRVLTGPEGISCRVVISIGACGSVPMILRVVDEHHLCIERHRSELPPEQAREYFREAGQRFEEYASERFPPVLDEPRAGDLALLAAVSYVATRAAPGYQSQLEEIFTTRRTGAVGKAIHSACLDALVGTAEDRAQTARFLAYVGSQPDPPPGNELCVDGLRRVEPEATEEMLAYLGRSTDGPQRRRLATLIQRVTRTPSPQPLRFWQNTTDRATIQATIASWRSEIAARPPRQPAQAPPSAPRPARE